MAVNPTPDPVLCADWSHIPRTRQPPTATAFVRGKADTGWTPRCDPCVRRLAAASADAVVVDVYELGPPRTTARYDADTTTH